MKIRGGTATAVLVALVIAGCAAKTPEEQAASATDEARAALASVTPTVAVQPQPAVLTSNPLYRTGRVAPAGCTMPGYAITSLSTARDFYTDLLRCLNKAWAPVVRAAGSAFQPPKLVVTRGRAASSPCTFPDGLAYYCDRTIYMDADADLSVKGLFPGVQDVWMAFNFGHEYAHHVQALTGILQAKEQRRSTLGDPETAREDTRRTELQASCLSGVYFGADAASIPVTAGWRSVYRSIFANSVDRAGDHGNKENQERWATAGLNAADPSACNTFTATPAEVS
ncbi:neutral zinc metallopeptidase [Kribbella sp. DT2]|uniref:neutral zinc metallopeptidase n=1 Tax=Kribbella sp. DT2 TaxID=3393427 RepID=UPI003CE9C2EB